MVKASQNASPKVVASGSVRSSAPPLRLITMGVKMPTQIRIVPIPIADSERADHPPPVLGHVVAADRAEREHQAGHEPDAEDQGSAGLEPAAPGMEQPEAQRQDPAQQRT